MAAKNNRAAGAKADAAVVRTVLKKVQAEQLDKALGKFGRGRAGRSEALIQAIQAGLAAKTTGGKADV